jgi:hypothetical protein
MSDKQTIGNLRGAIQVALDDLDAYGSPREASKWARWTLEAALRDSEPESEDHSLTAGRHAETRYTSYLPDDCPRCGRRRREATIVIKRTAAQVSHIVCEKCGLDSRLGCEDGLAS